MNLYDEELFELHAEADRIRAYARAHSNGPEWKRAERLWADSLIVLSWIEELQRSRQIKADHRRHPPIHR